MATSSAARSTWPRGWRPRKGAPHTFDVGGYASIRDNSVVANDLNGISAGTSSVVAGNAVGSSGLVGIEVGDGGVVSDNTVYGSGADGITAGTGSTIRGNSVYDNGSNSSHDGVHCTLGCRVQDNAIRGGTGLGLRFDSNSSGYSGNTIGANARGTVENGRDTGGNVCGTSTTCP